MAVTPVGNPYVESSDLVANYPGVSEALAERIDIVGVNPFADSAARATAIPSPVEGQMASLNDDDQVYRYSGSAWVAVGLPPGLNPIAPTSIANSGGSASVSGFTTTFTGVTSLSLDGVFSARYQNYFIIMTRAQTSNGSTFNTRLRVGGVDNSTASAYVIQRLIVDNTAINGARVTSNLWSILYASSNAANMGTIEIARPFDVNRTTFTSSNQAADGGAFMTLYSGSHNADTSFDGITFTETDGNSTGTVRVYGYAN